MIQPSRRSCSRPSSATSWMRACGTTTAPSRSVTMRSSGKTATPPQSIGCCQPTKVRPATEGGAAMPPDHTGRPTATTPSGAPAPPALLLETALGDLLDEGLRHHHGAVPVGDDEVVGEDRDATAGDRLLPADEGEAGHRGWCGDAAGPYRQAARLDAVEVAQHAVGHQGGDAALGHARAEDVADDTRVLPAQGVDHGDAALRHVLAGAARAGPIGSAHV